MDSQSEYYITCHLADTFIQSNLQLIRLSRKQSPLEQCGVKGSTAVQILSWPHQGTNQRPYGSKSCSLTFVLSPALSHCGRQSTTLTAVNRARPSLRSTGRGPHCGRQGAALTAGDRAWPSMSATGRGPHCGRQGAALTAGDRAWPSLRATGRGPLCERQGVALTAGDRAWPSLRATGRGPHCGRQGVALTAGDRAWPSLRATGRGPSGGFIVPASSVRAKAMPMSELKYGGMIPFLRAKRHSSASASSCLQPNQ